MCTSLTNLGKALLNLILGSLLGLLLFEGVLHINPTVLPRGMELPFPVDHAITSQTYQVFYTDADLFFWHSDLIQPIKPEDDRVEANVEYHLDQFGFPNQYPQPEDVDVVVLGRSFSMGAQATDPWVRRVEKETNLTILNLSQTGGGLSSKMTFLQSYGFPHTPEWIVLEVLPSLDILEVNPDEDIRSRKPIISDIPWPIIQLLGRSLGTKSKTIENNNYIYPLSVIVNDHITELTFFGPHLEALTVSSDDLSESKQWELYSKGLSEFLQLAEHKDICLAILLAPTKPDVYFPLSVNPAQLDVLSPYIDSWSLDANGTLAKDLNVPPDGITMQQNALDQWSLLKEYANQNGIPFINPIPNMQAAVNEGHSPFMQYDSHWGPLGHRIVAELVEETLSQSSCK